mmetsp:Transcript_12906/g.40944  ORF Transcript_12906/g.40944 Transcript_12906/m.40944 type:complete len:191 (-) Transcript_12906:423-995(-)
MAVAVGPTMMGEGRFGPRELELECLARAAILALIEGGATDVEIEAIHVAALEMLGSAEGGRVKNRPLAVSWDEKDEALMAELERAKEEQEAEAQWFLDEEDEHERLEAERQLTALRVEAAGRNWEEKELLDAVALERREEDDLEELAELAEKLDASLPAPTFVDDLAPYLDHTSLAGLRAVTTWCSNLFA